MCILGHCCCTYYEYIFYSRLLYLYVQCITVQESEVEQRVHAAREKEWEKLVVLEKERIELEERVAELQKLVDCYA